MRVAPGGRSPRASATSPTSRRSSPASDRVVSDDDGGAADEPVTMMDYNASITYTLPVTANVKRAEEANDEGRFPRSQVSDLRTHVHRRQGLLHRRDRARPRLQDQPAQDQSA